MGLAGGPGLTWEDEDCFFLRRPDMKTIRKLFLNNKGATAIEYGLIAALIAVAAIAAMQSLGTTIGDTLNNAATKMK